MYSLKEFNELTTGYFCRILCPDGRIIGYFGSYTIAAEMVKELNSLKNPN